MNALKMAGYCLIAISFLIPILLRHETSETK